MVAVTTIASGEGALKDLRLFFYTLSLFNTKLPSVYLLCDKYIAANVAGLYKGKIHIDQGLEQYRDLNRVKMEKMPGKTYKTLWEDYMMEKATVLDIAFKNGESGVFFFDCDICFMGPLPEPPTTAKGGVCRHMIRPWDEQRFGIYNAGYLYTTDPNLSSYWRKAAITSRYYDQAALENVVKHYTSDQIFEFPIQNNYGWWRMYQSLKSPTEMASEWGLLRKENHSGIKAHGNPLLSIHTHWGEQQDMITVSFNKFVYQILLKLNSHKPANVLVKYLEREFPHLKST